MFPKGVSKQDDATNKKRITITENIKLSMTGMTPKEKRWT